MSLPDETEQPVDVLSSVTATLSPDVAEALGVYEPLTLPAEGAEPTEIEFAVDPTANAAVGIAMAAPPMRRADANAVAENLRRTEPVASEVLASPREFFMCFQPSSSIPDQVSGRRKLGLDVLI